MQGEVKGRRDIFKETLPSNPRQTRISKPRSLNNRAIFYGSDIAAAYRKDELQSARFSEATGTRGLRKVVSLWL